MTTNNNYFIIILIIIYILYNYLQNMEFNGPCLQHCYKKYNIFLLIGIFLIGYYVCKKRLIDV